MELIKSMRNGNFDKNNPDDTSNVSPSAWHRHFSDLLSKKIEVDPNIKSFINENKALFESELGVPFTKEELLVAIKGLKNNKSTSLDQVSNKIFFVFIQQNIVNWLLPKPVEGSYIKSNSQVR